jgi:hypothetical protein
MDNNKLQTQQAITTPITRAPVAIGDRGLEVKNLEDLWRISGYIVKSGFAPKGLQTQEAVFVAGQLGLELGLTLMAGLQNIGVINGRPGIYGDAALALARNSPQFGDYQEYETDNESDMLFRQMCLEDDLTKKKALLIKLTTHRLNRTAPDFGWTVYARRNHDIIGSFGRFTVQDAKTADLWGKQGPWTQYPARMLKFRARGFVLRDTFGDVLKGFRTTEELQDMPEAARAAVAKPALVHSTTTVSVGEPAPEPEPTRQPEQPAQPAEVTAAAPAQASSIAGLASTPQHDELEKILTDAGFTFGQLLEWGQAMNVIPDADSHSVIAELHSVVVEKLLSRKSAMLRGLASRFPRPETK